MKYYKIEKDEYIYGVGLGEAGEAITEAEYNEIMTAIRSKPQTSYGVGYHLRTDLTWERYEFTPEPTPTHDPTADEILNILLGGDTE